MQSFLEEAIDDIKKEISDVLKIKTDEIHLIISEKDTDWDIAFCSASVVGLLRENPVHIAEKITKGINKSIFIDKIEQKNIYVNFFLKKIWLTRNLLEQQSIDKNSNMKLKKKVIIEYPSVNPGKPLHIGHCRNAVLGASLSKIYEFCGTGVLKTDYIDDLGLQAACVTWGLLNMKESELPPKKEYALKTDQWQGRVYTIVNNKMKEDAKTDESVRELMKTIEERKDKALIKKHDEFVEQCLLAQCQTRWRLGIFHDLKIHESYLINSKLYEKSFALLEKNKNILYETTGDNKGCWVAKLGMLAEYKNMKNPDKILVRSNGTSTYTAKDLSLHFWKFSIIPIKLNYNKWIKQPNNEYIYTADCGDGEKKEYNLKKEKVINVIGSEQIYTQKAMYDLLKLCGYNYEYNNSVHIAYEHVWFKDKGEKFKFSGRSGNWIGYSTDEVLDKVVQMALNGVKERQQDKTEKWQKEIAELLGCSAVKFMMLKTSWTKKIAFDWDKIMDMKGDTACYLQYSYARARGIMRKAKMNEDRISRELETSIFGTDECMILRKLSLFVLIAKKAKKENSPNLIANYCIEIAGLFNSFYAKNPVLNSEEKIKNARLIVVLAFSKTLKQALSLLLIDCADEI
ncbi:MAG: arginine--tRNA ligase [Candidatus Aenigmarchaeota archaeon]|nr:arginine--tRNA ligase [Candidatus Aenigmarchaeota archaeon]